MFNERAVALIAISVILLAYSLVVHVDIANAASDNSESKNGKWLKEKLKETAQKVGDSIGKALGPGSPCKLLPYPCRIIDTI
jgi:hypothetical protein